VSELTGRPIQPFDWRKMRQEEKKFVLARHIRSENDGAGDGGAGWSMRADLARDELHKTTGPRAETHLQQLQRKYPQ